MGLWDVGRMAVDRTLTPPTSPTSPTSPPPHPHLSYQISAAVPKIDTMLSVAPAASIILVG